MNDTVVLIPAYDPTSRLVWLTNELAERGLAVLVVNDGSSPACGDVFSQAAATAQVIGYEQNRGKGHALKFGLEYIQKQLPGVKYFVTADADGQHAPDDIARVAQALRQTDGVVIGARGFEGKIPFRSRFGNDMSRLLYAVSNDRLLWDNQSGLRGFGIEAADWLTCVPGERYEYEMNALMYAAKRGCRVTEIPIETIYENGNESSHFEPVPDTLRIHRVIYAASWASIAAAAAKYLLAVLLCSLLANNKWCLELSLAIAGAAGILISLLLNSAVYDVPRRALPPVWPHLARMVIRLAAQLGLCEALCRAGGLPLWAGLPIAGLIVMIGGYYIMKLADVGRQRRAVTA